MPFKSKSQMRKCFAMKARSEAGSWNCEEWARHTKSVKKLPAKKANEHQSKQAQDPNVDPGAAEREAIAEDIKRRLEQLRPYAPFIRSGLYGGLGGGLGMLAGGALGSLTGLGRGNLPEGLGRGIIRGGATGVGAALGSLGGGLLAERLGASPETAFYAGRLPGLGLGGLAGYGLSGLALGEPAGRKRKRDEDDEEGKTAADLGPYKAQAAAGVVGLDDLIAAIRRNREERFGHYLLNPFVSGPAREMLARLLRRMYAVGATGGWPSTIASATPGVNLLAAIAGGPKRRIQARESYAASSMPSFESGPDEAAAEKTREEWRKAKKESAPDKSAADKPTGPYRAEQAAMVSGLDKLIAALERNRQERFGHYLLNPFVGGPLTEVALRLGRRSAATRGTAPVKSELGSMAGGVLFGPIGQLTAEGVIAALGGPSKRVKLREELAASDVPLYHEAREEAEREQRRQNRAKPVEEERKAAAAKEAKRDMPSFTKQDRPKKVKEIYKAIKREHPGMPAEVKARIASRKGEKSPQKRKPPETGGPAYKAPLHFKRRKGKYVKKSFDLNAWLRSRQGLTPELLNFFKQSNLTMGYSTPALGISPSFSNSMKSPTLGLAGGSIRAPNMSAMTSTSTLPAA